MWFDSGGSNVNKVGWLECDGAEDFRSRSRCWLELLSSAGEERGPWLAKEMFLRDSVNAEGKEGVLIPKWVVRRRRNIKKRGNNPVAAFSPSHVPAPSLPSQRGGLWPPGHLGEKGMLCTLVLLLESPGCHFLSQPAPLLGGAATCAPGVWLWPSSKGSPGAASTTAFLLFGGSCHHLPQS